MSRTTTSADRRERASTLPSTSQPRPSNTINSRPAQPRSLTYPTSSVHQDRLPRTSTSHSRFTPRRSSQLMLHFTPSSSRCPATTPTWSFGALFSFCTRCRVRAWGAVRFHLGLETDIWLCADAEDTRDHDKRLAWVREWTATHSTHELGNSRVSHHWLEDDEWWKPQYSGRNRNCEDTGSTRNSRPPNIRRMRTAT